MVTIPFTPSGVVSEVTGIGTKSQSSGSSSQTQGSKLATKQAEDLAAAAKAGATGGTAQAAHDHRSHRHQPADLTSSMDRETALRSGVLIVFLALILGLFVGRRRAG